MEFKVRRIEDSKDSKLGQLVIKYLFYDKGEEKLIVKPIVLEGILGSKIRLGDELYFTGYKYKTKEPSIEEIIIEENPKEIKYIYTRTGDKPVETEDLDYNDGEVFTKYTIRYLDKDGRREILRSKNLIGLRNSQIKVESEDIKGYKISGLKEMEINLEKENSIVFLYERVREVDKEDTIESGKPIDPEEPIKKPEGGSKGEEKIDKNLNKLEDKIREAKTKDEREELLEELKEIKVLIDGLDMGKEKNKLLERYRKLNGTLRKQDNIDNINKKKKFAYIYGYKDKTIRPEANISRAEVASIIYRIMDEAYVSKFKNVDSDFLDTKGHWAEKELEVTEKMGIIYGYGDNTFRPDNLITRAEVASILSYFMEVNKERVIGFKDIEGHWAEKDINILTSANVVQGYEDNTFRPDELIKRAEFITMINRIIDRDLDGIGKDLERYKDLDKNMWYYKEILKALGEE